MVALGRVPGAELVVGLRRKALAPGSRDGFQHHPFRGVRRSRAAHAARTLHFGALRRRRHCHLRSADRLGDEEDHVPMKSALVIDDDPALAEVSQRCLERAGYSVLRARDGLLGLEMLAKDPLPDLVLLDVMLPKIDGFEVLRRIRADARTRSLPVVMVTSFSRDKDAARGRALGADDYIVKPLMETDFLNRIRRLVRHR